MANHRSLLPGRSLKPHVSPAFVAPSTTARLPARGRAGGTAIDATLEHGLSNVLIESVNTKIRLITWVAFGFHDPAVLIALAMLSLGGYRPPLPGR